MKRYNLIPVTNARLSVDGVTISLGGLDVPVERICETCKLPRPEQDYQSTSATVCLHCLRLKQAWKSMNRKQRRAAEVQAKKQLKAAERQSKNTLELVSGDGKTKVSGAGLYGRFPQS